MSEKVVRTALCHPLVLRGAWLRIDAWYRSGSLAPQPDLTLWRLHSEAELRKLGAELRADHWRPSVWPQVPYPKKGARLRHYTLPAVKDQVAFMAHMVLLGPLLDSCFENFSLGNRWYRPLVWNRRRDPSRWEFRPYPLLTHRTHRPFSSSHGLYRRVANWTVARMTRAHLSKTDYSGAVHHPDDYSDESLPPWVYEEWWSGGASTTCRAAWATLDIELAYPSVRLDQLMRSGIATLEDVVEPLDKSIIGYPEPVRDLLNDSDCRQQILRSLVDGLQRVTVNSDNVARNTWRPVHAAPRLPPDNMGLPTGLAVSGMLLNLVLHDTDRSVLEYLTRQPPDSRGAFIRFADDMVVLSRSARGLMDLIDAVWRGLTNDDNAKLAASKSESNLYLGVGKISPRPVRDLVKRYFGTQGWKQCNTPRCDQLIRRNDKRELVSLGEWWGKAEDTVQQDASLLLAVERSMVGPEDLGPFVTTLVTRLSEIAKDTLSERFGEGARTRLVQLHDLARLDIDDRQIRADTRRAFAVNRLAKAWLPGDHDDVAAALVEIRGSIAHVLQATPWKYSVWRAIVRAAARRPPSMDESGSREDDDIAATWMSAQLRRVAYHASKPADRMSWMHSWPEVEDDGPHKRDPSWRPLYLSFHRTVFWQALAGVLSTLRQHEHWMQRSREGKAGHPPPRLWAVRAIPEGDHADVIRFIGELDRWVEVLYPSGPSEPLPDLDRWTWELDQFVAAFIAAHSASAVAEAWRRSERPDKYLMVPEALSSPRLERTMQILNHFGRICAEKGSPHYLNESALAHVGLAGHDEKVGRLLFPPGKRPRILGSGRDPTHTLMTGLALGCSENVDRNLAGAVLEVTGGPHEVHRDSLSLWEYASARRIVLGSGVVPMSGPVTLHRILWGPAPAQDVADWHVRAWETPAVGLPVRVAIALFLSAMRPDRHPDGWTPSAGPLTWEIRKGKDVLAVGRQRQFGFSRRSTEAEEINPDPASTFGMVRRSRVWEVYPHPAYFLPFSAEHPRDVNPSQYALYCDVLLLLTAIDGGEAILSRLASNGANVVPFEDRWDWRSRVHLPKEAWKRIERVFRWAEAPAYAIPRVREELAETLEHWAPNKIEIQSFVAERVDILLPSDESLGNDIEIVQTVRSPGSLDSALPEDLWLDGTTLAAELRVRIGQIERWAHWSHVVKDFPHVDSKTTEQIMEQVAAAFQSPGHGHHGSGPDLVLLPEVSITNTEVTTVRDLVKETGRASLAGLYWRVLPPVYSGPAAPSRKWFANEAELVLPIGYDDRGPTGIRWYRVRKPVPAHMEVGLARALGTEHGIHWDILPGQRWYRFVHPKWGDFTIAICSDLLDAAPWRSLRGEILHLFMVAFNSDVGLFESLTWVRAYENYVNLISVNHGSMGGSFVWTPRRSHERELAQLRGHPLFLLADVDIPVKQMIVAQRDGVEKARRRSKVRWLKDQGVPTDFKSPPPGYTRKSESG